MLSGLIISAFLLIVSIIFGLTLFKAKHKEDKEKFSFLNHFPFELNSEENQTQDIIFKIVYVLSFATLGFGFISLITTEFAHYYGVAFVVAFLGFLGCIASVILFFLNTRNIKFHLLCFTILTISSLVDSFAVIYLGFYSLNYVTMDTIDIKKIVLASIMCVLALINLIIIIWPRKQKWYELDSVDDNGSIDYRRPKKFYLAYIEWLSSLMLYVNLLFTIIMFI